ncbi:MAG TPA: acyltransferase family protein [Vicinamibacterales bacterium]|nr:acyltransferase family protein [Vicinamibacterales bacterium]
MIAEGNYRPDIDGLRALAVVAVLGFHLFPQRARGGFVGVDVFFVISGFLISSLLMRDIELGRPIFGRFYARRVRRIFPALVAVLVAVFGIGWLLLLPGEFSRLGEHVAGAAGFVANLLYWNESGYFDQAAAYKPLLHLWSLGIEEQFYLVWPALLVLIWRTRERTFWFVALLAGSFTLSVVTVYSRPAAAFYSPLDRFWELLTGGALAFAARDDRLTGWWQQQTALRHLCSLAGIGLIVLAVVKLDSAAAFPGWKVLAPVAGTCLVIGAGSSAWFNRRLLSLPPVVWLGLISYPLYLWHWPLISFVRIAGGEPSRTARVAVAVASVALAALTYQFIERPVRSRPATLRMALMLGVLMACVGGLGVAALSAGGFPGRLPEAARQIADFSYDDASAYRRHRCFLLPDLNERTVAPECLDSGPATRTLKEIALWGDSHAAHLYPGLSAVYRGSFRLSQLTAAGCPPLFGVEGSFSNCPELTAAAFDTIAARKPAVVILGGQWISYEWRVLPATIRRLRAAGVETIVVAGEAPIFDAPFPSVVARDVLADRPRFRVPERTGHRLSPGQWELDREMGALVRASGAQFESPLAILCNDEGCLTRTGEGIDSLIMFDARHLTGAGSRYVVEHFGRLE